MEKSKTNELKSVRYALLLLIPALLFAVISLALAVVGLGLIPVFPALVSIILVAASFMFFRKSYRLFTMIVTGLAIVAIVVSVLRGAILEKKVNADQSFENTVIETQQGIDSDLNDAFSDTEDDSVQKTDSVEVK